LRDTLRKFFLLLVLLLIESYADCIGLVRVLSRMSHLNYHSLTIDRTEKANLSPGYYLSMGFV